MKKHKTSLYIIFLLPFVMAAAFIAGLIFLFSSIEPAFAFSGDHALEFDGQDDMVVLTYTAQIFNGTWEDTKTVSLWMRPKGSTDVCDAPTPAHCDLIFGDRPRWWGVSRGIISGNDRIWVWNYDEDLNYDIIGIEYTVGEWVNIALVHGNGRLKAYKNGVEVGNISSSTTQQPANPSQMPILHIGGMIKDVNSIWVSEGQIDEVLLWDRALLSEEIRQNMYRTHTGSEIGLAAYYQMSNGSGSTLTDNSGNGHTGTLTSGGPGVPSGDLPFWVTSGAFAGPRNTLDFDGGDDYIDLGTTSNDMIGSGWAATKSVSLWIKPTGISPSVITYAASGDWIFGANDGSAHWGISQATIGLDDKIWVWNVDGGGEERIGIDYVAGEWVQIALVHDSGRLTAYKNGVQIGNTPSGNTSGDGTLFISGLSGGQNFQGQVDEVRVWDTARTETQIREDAFHTLAHNASGLVAYYRFDQDDDSTHTNLYNAVTNNFTGTLTNMDPGTAWAASTAFNTWIGSDSTNWTVGGNWSRYTTPLVSDHVGIYNYVASHQPEITSTVTISNIVVTAGGVLSIGNNGQLTVGPGDTLIVNSGANLSANPGGILEIVGDGNGVIINGDVTNDGTFQHIQNVNTESKAFLLLEDEGGTTIKYRGATITTTNNLGTVTTTVRTVDRSSSFCTSDGVTSPLYANRCFEINAENNAAATLRLWALTSEVDSGITTPSVYRYTGSGGIWTELTTNTDNGTSGAYTYAESDTPGFSHFLIAQSGNAPTAVSLQSFSGASATYPLIPVFGAVLLLGLGINTLRKMRSQ